MWVIDRLALRVGGEKNENEADTVGCCSLRREHITFISRDIDTEPMNYDDEKPPKKTASETLKNSAETLKNYEIELEFLGKDSMLYKQTINLQTYGIIGIKIYNRFKLFCRNKQPSDDIFDSLTPTDLNKHLNSILPGIYI